MATARTAAIPAGVAVDGLARLCDLAAQPVPTSVVRGPDGARLVVELLDAGSRPQLGRDALALLRLRHPNLVHVRKVETRPGAIALVSDYVEGETFEELCRA